MDIHGLLSKHPYLAQKKDPFNVSILINDP